MIMSLANINYGGGSIPAEKWLDFAGALSGQTLRFNGSVCYGIVRGLHLAPLDTQGEV